MISICYRSCRPRVRQAAREPSFVALEGDKNDILFASFSPDGTHVITTAWERAARVWDLRDKPPTFVVLEGHLEPIRSGSFSIDGTRVVTASYDKTARVWDLRRQRLSFV